ncbi:MAG: hypothetical protein IJ001_04600 [Oscillospiraceae bacterium]|nr:hypothetical protein [Oscillospiraceae bacterium]
MKRIWAILVILLFLAATALSFFVGDYMSDKQHMEDRLQRCGRYVSFAIDTIEDKGLSLEGALDAITSNIWVAHELCDDPELSAELSNLWNILVYEEGAYAGQEDVLISQLKDILNRCQ